MRYQERIYIQNDHQGVRNKDILNVNMSSDICIFSGPTFTLSGTSKLDCTSGMTSYYVISGDTSFSAYFRFTGNTNSFTANSPTFKFEVYKYNNILSGFTLPPVYQSDNLPIVKLERIYHSSDIIPYSSLTLDGEYLIKGYYEFSACTDFLGRLGKSVDTLTYRSGTEYGLYDKNLDYYVLFIKSAEIPILASNSNNTPVANTLAQQIIIPDEGQTTLVIPNSYNSTFILTLNGLVLAPNYDYIVSGNVITLSSTTVQDDIFTVIYTTAIGDTLVGENINVSTSVVSGSTNNEGNNMTYFNTTTGKYEIYTQTTPMVGPVILVMINGVTLGNNIDYYQSTSNPKRIILEGNIVVGDIITIVYYPVTNIINGLITNNPYISWNISNPPQISNGYFSLEVSKNESFSPLYYSGYTPYVIDETNYFDSFIASGETSTNLYYRIKNEKDYTTICGDIVTTIAYSDIVPLTILTNAINSY